MKIAVIGTGKVGGTLGKRWAEAGHSVLFGSRDPQDSDTQALIAEIGFRAQATTPQQAASASDIILLAVPWASVKDLIPSLGDLKGKTVMDATNPLLPKLAGLELGTSTSAAEEIARWAPEANVVKAFNTVGFNISADPQFGGARALLFYCGDDRNAKQQVHELATALGFDPHDAGPLSMARYLEPLAFLWITLSLKPDYGREFAFQFLSR